MPAGAAAGAGAAAAAGAAGAALATLALLASAVDDEAGLAEDAVVVPDEEFADLHPAIAQTMETRINVAA